MAAVRLSLPRQRLRERAAFKRLVARSRGVEMSDDLWEYIQSPGEEPDLVFPTAIFPAEQVTTSTAGAACIAARRFELSCPRHVQAPASVPWFHRNLL